MAVEPYDVIPPCLIRVLPICQVDPDIALWIGVTRSCVGIAAPRLCDETGGVLTRVGTRSGNDPRFAEQLSWFEPRQVERWYPRLNGWLAADAEDAPLAMVAAMLLAERLVSNIIARDSRG